MFKKTIERVVEHKHWIVLKFNGHEYYYDPTHDIFMYKTKSAPEIKDVELVADLYERLEAQP